MYRVSKMGKRLLAVKCNLSSATEREKIQTLVDEGDPVILVNELDELEVLGFTEPVEEVE